MKVIEQAIAAREASVVALQKEIETLRTAGALLGGPLLASPEAIDAERRRKPGRKPRKAALPPAPPMTGVQVGSALDKPDTVVGAIKLLLRGEAVGAQFTAGLIRKNLLEDADYRKLLEADGGEKAFSNALCNWTNTDKLKKVGRGDEAEYTITAAGKEWFG